MVERFMQEVAQFAASVAGLPPHALTHAGGETDPLNFSTLGEISFASLAANDMLQYDGTNWANKTIAQIQAQFDHGALIGLGDDDHTQYHTDARALTWLGTRSTSDLPEGSNLYYTDVRADARIAAASIADLATKDHDLLTGLGDDDHTQYVHVSIARTISALHTFSHASGIKINTIVERTAAAGVTVDGLLIKDGGIPQGAVTAHQAALVITESQISDLNHVIAAVGDIGDVTLTAIAAGELLKWTGAVWINNTLAEAGVAPASHTHVEADITNLVHYTSTNFNTDFSGKSTTDLSEGTNLYYTDVRADARIAVANLEDISDVVAYATLVDGEILVQNAAAGGWRRRTLVEAGVSAVGHTHAHSALTGIGIDDHHARDHALVGSAHTASGLTIGHFLKALTTTTFGFTAHGLSAGDVGAAAASHTHDTADIATGTFVSARLNGSYAGITGLGTLTDNLTISKGTPQITLDATGGLEDVFLVGQPTGAGGVFKINAANATGVSTLDLQVDGSSILRVTPGAASFFSNAVTMGALSATAGAFSARVTITEPESMRFVDDETFISFFNSANSARSGYLQVRPSNTASLTIEVNQPFHLRTNDLDRIVIATGGDVTIAKSLNVDGALDLGNDLEFAERIGNLIIGTNNNVATGTVTAQRLVAHASNSTVTGFAGGRVGRLLVVMNIGSGILTLANQNTSSTAANRLILPGSTMALAAGEACMFWYDAATERWRLIANGNAP